MVRSLLDVERTAGTLFVALVLIDVCTCSSFAAQPSTGAASNKTYKGEQFKFSFDYPASWSVQERSASAADCRRARARPSHCRTDHRPQ